MSSRLRWAWLLEELQEGWDGLMAHRMRSLLSGLGILFGVAAILGILSIGEGASREQEAMIRQLGILNIQVRNVDLSADPEREEEVRRVSEGLALADVEVLRASLPQARLVGATRELTVTEVVPRPKDLSDVSLMGATPEWLAGSSLVLERGRPLTSLDEGAVAPVCLLGSEAVRSVFGPTEPVGQRIRVGTTWLRVVGVFRTAGSGSLSSADVEDHGTAIIVPLSTALRRLAPGDDGPPLSEIQITVADLSDVPHHVRLVQRVLHRVHREQSDTEITVPLRLLEQSQQQQRLFSLVMGLIAGISLLVGGIGIMNIMLASVLERTREIGIRLAVGARPRDISRLFLVEASMISLIGGVLGVVAGLTLSMLVAAGTGWATAVSPQALVLVLVLSTTEGLLFGYLPARRAASLPPVIAVRQG